MADDRMRSYDEMMAASRAAPSSPVADDGLPELPEPRAIRAGDGFPKVYALAFTADQMRQAQREAYEAGRAAGNRSREITEILCNPQWGEPDLYARLRTALAGEYELAQKHGKADAWTPAAHSLIDYLTAKKEPG